VAAGEFARAGVDSLMEFLQCGSRVVLLHDSRLCLG
jgi:hypothetical protein